MSAHSFLPPSGSSSWSKCAKWAAMNSCYPDGGSSETEEGTAAHYAAWEILAGRPCSEGTPTPNNLVVTAEMIEGGELLAEVVRQRTKGLQQMSQLYIEQKISIASIHPMCFGTPDLWFFNQAHIDIIDYKFGHRFVDEYFNSQGLCYLVGIIEFLKWHSPDISVSFTVIQPRCFYKGASVRTHDFTLAEAAEYIEQLQRAAILSMLPQPVATTNSNCGFCPGRHACSALQQAAYSDAEFATDRAPLDLSPAQASLELKLLMRASERLEARVDGLRELTLTNLKSGKSVPHFRAESGKGHAKWTLPDAQIIEIGKMFGADLSKPGTITPAQALKAGVNDAVIAAYTERPPTAVKLIADNPADARRVFGNSPE